MPRRPREYFSAASGFPLHRVPDVDPPIPHYSDLRGVVDWRDHFDVTLRHGTTPNGVFGAKVMWMHLPDLGHWPRVWVVLGCRTNTNGHHPLPLVRRTFLIIGPPGCVARGGHRA